MWYRTSRVKSWCCFFPFLYLQADRNVCLLWLTELPPGQDCQAEGQCVDMAECSTPQGGICTCNEGYYRDVGRCSPLIVPGDRCSDDAQCVGNAVCSNTGVCQCSPGYYALDGACAVSILVQRRGVNINSCC